MGEAQRAGPEGVADQDVELSLSRGARASNGTDPQVVRELGAVRGGVGWGFCGGAVGEEPVVGSRTIPIGRIRRYGGLKRTAVR